MNKVIAVFLLVAVSAVLSHPGQVRDDAIASPVAIALDAAQPVPPVESSPAPVPEEQPTSAALLDDATGKFTLQCRILPVKLSPT